MYNSVFGLGESDFSCDFIDNMSEPFSEYSYEIK